MRKIIFSLLALLCVTTMFSVPREKVYPIKEKYSAPSIAPLKVSTKQDDNVTNFVFITSLIGIVGGIAVLVIFVKEE